MNPKFKLFVDLDGVLADFDAGVVAATGKTPAELPDFRLWPILAKTPGFYENLPWMADGRQLWDFCLPYQPTVLTGLPRGKWAEGQKRAWCVRELGADIPVICCLSKEKGQAAAATLAPGQIPILVDDRLKAEPGWLDVGGIFVLHLSAQQSIEKLQERFRS